MSDAIYCPWGHRHVLPILSAKCWHESDGATPPYRVAVTLREYDVLQQLLRHGSGNRQIAKALFLTEDTIKTHVKGLLRRTGTDTRTELISAVFRGRIQCIPVPVAATKSALPSADPEMTVPASVMLG